MKCICDPLDDRKTEYEMVEVPVVNNWEQETGFFKKKKEQWHMYVCTLLQCPNCKKITSKP